MWCWLMVTDMFTTEPLGTTWVRFKVLLVPPDHKVQLDHKGLLAHKAFKAQLVQLVPLGLLELQVLLATQVQLVHRAFREPLAPLA
jgi:hypothetical protein